MVKTMMKCKNMNDNLGLIINLDYSVRGNIGIPNKGFGGGGAGS